MTLRVDPGPTHFLNVDLDIYSQRDLQPLVTALGKKVLVLFVGRLRRTYETHLELARSTKTADATIRGFCALVRSLPARDRTLWNTAKVRQFCIGVQAGTTPASSDYIISPQTIRAVAELGARISVTVYAPNIPLTDIVI